MFTGEDHNESGIQEDHNERNVKDDNESNVLVDYESERRVGETQRFLIVDYGKKRGLQKDSDEYQYLSHKEKESGNEYVRFEAKGKCIRGVPVLLTTKEAEYIDKFILKMRKYTNIVDDNPYVFAIGETSLDGCYCMRSIRYACDAKYPELLTRTKLRKHLASSTQVLNLTA